MEAPATLLEANLPGFHQIVPATSATIDGYSVEQISVPEDHMGMARYATRLKIGYKRICSVLEELVDDEAGILNSARATWITGNNNPF